jgi:peptidoglycan/LPS O-acetylase OafA/YrhL
MTHQKYHNSLDLARLIAACFVIIGHSPVLLGQSQVFEIFGKIIGCQSIHGMAVDVFFIISGYLITKSYFRNPNPYQYLKNRFLRIIPGLAFALVLGLFLFYFLQDLSALDYLRANIKYLLNVFLIKDFYILEGVFAQNNLKEANGSLWTLKYEFVMYLMILALGVTRTLNKYIIGILTLIAMFLTLNAEDLLIWKFFDLGSVAFYHFLMFYLLGTCVYFFEDILRKIPHLGLILMVLYFLIRFLIPNSSIRIDVLFVLFPLAVLILCKEPFRFAYDAKKWGDYSYGIYLWGFPAQQFFISESEFFRTHNHYFLTLASLSLSFVFAWISWRYIEKPALAAKN